MVIHYSPNIQIVGRKEVLARERLDSDGDCFDQARNVSRNDRDSFVVGM